ncbi:MAG: hypothetical protein Tsb009_35920 [Planctomycetaceae bacterium]
MTDIGIFIFGCCVFGITLTSTLVCVIGPSNSSVKDREMIESANQELHGELIDLDRRKRLAS